MLSKLIKKYDKRTRDIIMKGNAFFASDIKRGDIIEFPSDKAFVTKIVSETCVATKKYNFFIRWIYVICWKVSEFLNKKAWPIGRNQENV